MQDYSNKISLSIGNTSSFQANMLCCSAFVPLSKESVNPFSVIFYSLFLKQLFAKIQFVPHLEQ